MSINYKNIITDKSTAIFNDVVDFLYPKICIITDKRIPDGNSNDFITDEVLDSFETIDESEFSFIRSKINADFFYSHYAFRHDNGIQFLVHYLKYKGFTKIGTYLGNVLGRKLFNNYNERLKDYGYLFPVPLFSARLRERGYNQSSYICEGISEITKLEILSGNIIRSKNTRSQTGLNMEERVLNMQDAFEINPQIENHDIDKGILVVDDILTTGSTIKEVIRLLKQSTTVNVGGITIGLAK